MTDPDPPLEGRENGLPNRYQQRLQERLRGAGKYYLSNDVVFKIKPPKRQEEKTPVQKVEKESPDKFGTPVVHERIDRDSINSESSSRNGRVKDISTVTRNQYFSQEISKSVSASPIDEQIIQDIPQLQEHYEILSQSVETPSFSRINRSVSLGASPEPSALHSEHSPIPSNRSSQKRKSRTEVEETPEPSLNPVSVTLDKEQPLSNSLQPRQSTPKPRKRRKKIQSQSNSDSDEPIHVNVYKAKNGQRHINEIDVVATAISDILSSMYEGIESRQKKILKSFEEEIQARLLLLTDALDQNFTLNTSLKKAQKQKSTLKLGLVETMKQIAQVKAEKEQVRRHYEADSLKFKEITEIQSFMEMFEQLKDSSENDGQVIGTETLAMALQQNVCGENGLAGQLKAFNRLLEEVDKLL